MDRRLGCAGFAWGAVGGAVAGFGVAAVTDLLVDGDWQGWWTLVCVLGGAVAVPALLWWLVGSGRTDNAQLTRVRRRLWRLREPGSLLVSLGAAYLGIWVAAPRQTDDTVIQFALLGVFAWPMLAGAVRIMVGRPPLWPPWWAALWLFIGVPVTVVILWVRAGHLTTWPDGVIAGAVILVPIAVWRYLRTRRRARDLGR